VTKITLENVEKYVDERSYGGAPLQASDHEHQLMALCRSGQAVIEAARSHFCGRKGATPANLPHIFCSICHALAAHTKLENGE
jgi:hypothetical protein